jgi:archaellum biogenesis ATPase FlaH
MPDKLEVLTVERIRAVVGESLPAEGTAEATAQSAQWVEGFLEKHGIAVHRREPYQGGEKWLLEQCPFCGNTDRSAVVTVSAKGALGFRCLHDSCRDRHWQEFRAHFESRDSDVGDQAPPERKRVYRIKELFQLPPVSWQVDRHLPHGSLCCIYGRYGTGKSFYAVDLALSAASGRPFLGQFKLSAMPVAYIAAEGHVGIAKRMHAWLDYFEVETPENLVVLPERHNLLDTGSLVELKDIMSKSLGQAPKLIICDTLARMFCGGDENSTQDMNRFVENVTQFGSMCGGASIVVLHHVGKDKTRGARGSVALAGACDTMIEISAKKEHNKIKSILVRCEKQKDGPEFPTYGLEVRQVELPFDEHGSLVLVPADTWEFKLQSMTEMQRRTLQALFRGFGPEEYTWTEGLSAANVGKSTFHKQVEKLKQLGFVNESHDGALVNQEEVLPVLSALLGSTV